MAISIEIVQSTTSITAQAQVINVVADASFPILNAKAVVVEPYGTITADTLQGALEQLADQDFRASEEPDPITSNIEEGDTWYNTATNNLYTYREISNGIFDWVPIMIGNISENSDTMDGGAF